LTEHEFIVLNSLDFKIFKGSPKRDGLVDPWRAGPRNGFLHRLDVPSSGLILAATGRKAFDDLKMQIAMGKVKREPSTEELTARFINLE